MRVIRYLEQNFLFPEGVKLIDGGVMGLNLLPLLTDVQHLILVDAIDCDADPGTIIRMEEDQLPANVGLKLSIHELGLSDLLALLELQGMRPNSITLWGIKPEKLDTGLELSKVVCSQVSTLAKNIIAELRNHGVHWIEEKVQQHLTEPLQTDRGNR